MNQIVPISPMMRVGALSPTDPQYQRRLVLFTKTVGKDLVGSEIDEAVEWCSVLGANPFTRDIHFFPFGKPGTAERKVVPVLSIGLYRKIATRSGDYRPDDRPARFRYDETLQGPDNPRGIVDCEVSVYRFSHNEWHPITERLRWDERAPIIEGGSEGFEWVETGETWEDSGKPKKKKVPKGEIIRMLDPGKKNWHTMPETMLSKCVEVAAIRKGWPEQTSGAYVEGELDAAHAIELTATEIISKAETDERLARIGGGNNTIMVDWLDDKPITPVPIGQFYDQAMAWIKVQESGEVLKWRERNRFALQTFWALQKDAALALKKEIERVEAMTKAPSK